MATASATSKPLEANGDRRLQNRAVFGVFMMIGGIALYAFSDAFVKHLMGTYSVHQTTFLRAITRLAPLLMATFFQGGIRHVLRTDQPKRHAVRLLVNLTYTLAFMYAVSLGSLTEVYTLSYTSPFFMIVLSAFLLKERIGRDRWIAVALGMIGVLVAMRPGAGVFAWTALLVLLGTFLGALNKILMRRLAETEHSLAIAIYPNFVMMICMMPFMFFEWQSMPWTHWALFVGVGGMTALGQYVIAQALRYTQASALAPIDYSSFFWVVALDLFWWDKAPGVATLIGAAIIVSSNFFILYRSRKESAGAAAAAA